MRGVKSSRERVEAAPRDRGGVLRHAGRVRSDLGLLTRRVG
jgi:hypothetical protein